MSFTEIASKVPDMVKTESNKSFDIDKRADISQVGKSIAGKGFDIDKRVSLDENHDNKSEKSLENRCDANDVKDVPEKGDPIPNKIEGMRRESEVKEELEKQYRQNDGYSIISEATLRNENGEIVRDTQTEEGRRIDFVVIKDGKAVDSIEVTSENEDKTDQSAKENRIRENGGNYIKDGNGNLIRIPDNIRTRIERRP